MEGFLVLILLFVLYIVLVTIWNFLVWLGTFIFQIKERWDKKKNTINIIQRGNLQEFKRLLNQFNYLEKSIQKAIYLNLYDISDIEKINVICQECFRKRNPLLVKLIVEKNWIASQPAQVKIYTILKTNQLKLIENSDGEEVKYLLDSLKGLDPEISNRVIVNRVEQSLAEIRIINQDGIDYLCQEWVLKEKNKFLESIIVKHKYQPVSPIRVKILTALKTQQLSLIENEGEEGLEILLEFLKEQDPEIADNSLKVLHNLTNQEGINYLCEQWAKDRDKKLEEIIINQKYLATFPSQVKILTGLKTGQLQLLSNLNLEETIILINTFDDLDKVIAHNAQKIGDFLQDANCKCLMFFMTEQWQKYERIDFDQNMLKNIFYDADSVLRKKITEKIKISGRSDWLQVIFAEKKRKNIELMTDYDWQVTVELLSKSDNNQEKWKLARQAPPYYSHQLLKQIHSLNFINREKSSQQNLIQLGKKVIPNLSDLISCINDNSETVTLTHHTDYIQSLVMNREGTLLASASGDWYISIKLWELSSGRLLHILTGHTYFVKSLVMNREGTLLASGSDDKTIKLWKLASGKLLNTLTGHTDDIKSLAMNREGTLLVSASGSYGNINLWELPSGKLLHTLIGYSAHLSLAMNKEGTLLASTGSYGSTNLWELPSGRLLHTLIGYRARSSLVMNREGTLLASGSNDKTIKLWELASGKLLNTLSGHTYFINSLVMNREGTLLVSCSSSTIKLWKIYSLDRLPVSKVVNYYDYIQDNLKRDDLNENQRNWFEFMLALVNNYRTFEIDIEDAPIISEAGEFDIEIEG